MISNIFQSRTLALPDHNAIQWNILPLNSRDIYLLTRQAPGDHLCCLLTGEPSPIFSTGLLVTMVLSVMWMYSNLDSSILPSSTVW